MNTIENRLVGHWIPSPPYFSIREYVEDQKMDHDGIGGQMLRQLQWPTCSTRQYPLMMCLKEHGFVTNLIMVLMSIPLVYTYIM